MTIIPWYTETETVLRLASEGASVRTIAAQTGISKSTVSRIIRGERVWDKRGTEGGELTDSSQNKGSQ